MSALAVALKSLTNLHPQDLRSVLDKHYPNATPVPRRKSDTVNSGIVMFDRMFPNGGFPKGRLSAWSPFGGATALLRATAYAQISNGERVAWVDTTATLAWQSWAFESGLILIRPKTRIESLRAADILLRSGAFSFVILAGADPTGTENVKLARATHEGRGAFVAVTSNTAMAGVKVASSISPNGYNWRLGPLGEPAQLDSVKIDINVASLGWNKRGSILLPIESERPRIALEPGVPDRRGSWVSRKKYLKTTG